MGGEGRSEVEGKRGKGNIRKENRKEEHISQGTIIGRR